MKTNKKWLSLLLAALMVMSIMPYAVSAEGGWNESALSPTMLTTSNPNWIKPSSSGHSTHVAVFEWWFDLTSEIRSDLIPNISSYPAGVTFHGLRDAGGITFDVITSNVGYTNRNAFDRDVATQYGKVATNGGQRIHGLEIVNISDQTRRVWINGAEWKDCGKSSFNANTAIGFLGVNEGTVAFVNPTEYPIADFDASGYAAQLTSSDTTKAVIGGTKLSGTSTDLALNHTLTLKKKMTVDTLKGLLTASNGATVAVLNANGETAQGRDIVGEDFAVQVTSNNTKVIVKYNVTTDFIWPDAPKAFENTDTNGAKQLIIYGTGSVTPQNPFMNPAKEYVFHYTYTPTATSTSDATNLSNTNTTYAYGAGMTLSVNGATDGWTPVVFTNGFEHQRTASLLLKADKGIYENAPINRGAAGDGAKLIGQERVGETYHITAVVRKQADGVYSQMYINGAKLAGGYVYSNPFNKQDGNALMFVGKGVKGTLSELEPGVYADFEDYYASYQAQVTAKENWLTITGDKTLTGAKDIFQNFGITVAAKEDITVAELLSGLNKEGITCKVYASANAESELAGDAIVPNGAVLKTTSQNGEVTLNYNITVIDPENVDVLVYSADESELKVSVISSNKAGKLYLAAFDENGKVLSTVALGEADVNVPYKFSAKLPLTAIAGKTVKAFYWTENLVPIDMKDYVNN